MARVRIEDGYQMLQLIAERQPVIEQRRIQADRVKKAQDDAAIRNLEDLRDNRTMHRGMEVPLRPSQAQRKIHAVTQVGVPAEVVSRFLHPSAPGTLTPQQVVLEARQKKARE